MTPRHRIAANLERREPLRRWMRHLPLVTGVLLALLVIIPLWARRNTEQLRERVTDVALPTRNSLLEVQNAFASELAAIRGFELTGDSLFLDDFKVALEKDSEATERLLRLAPQLGPDVATAVSELHARKQAWLEEPQEVLAGTRTRQDLIRSLTEGERRVDAVLRAADQANGAVIKAESSMRATVESDERWATALVSALALVALLVIVVVGWLVRRLNVLAAQLRQGVEEEASLHHVAGTLNSAPSVEEIAREVAQAAMLWTRSKAVYMERLRDGQVEVISGSGGTPQVAVNDPEALRLPLNLEGGPFGALVLVPDGTADRFSDSETAYATALGDLVSAALGRVLVIEREHSARMAAEDALRYRDQLLRVVSHDLKNPLHTIGMVMDLMAATPDTERERGHQNERERGHQFQIVRRTVDSMNRLIHDLLDAARVQSGHALAVSLSPIDLPAFLLELEEQFAPQTTSKNIRLEILPVSTPQNIVADRDRLLQVFSNLIGNAIKFTREGGKITVDAKPEANGNVCFSIADTGSGIPAEHLPHLFEPFWQAHDRASLGTGLGLSIARGIVEAHGGVISVHSLPGEGTTFSFTIPQQDT
ncbi:MAG: ATP-binding protein [Gemmatimonadota bacterium]|nr:ATP-binding protein [Gemmatimonadota bacterium]